MPLTETDLCTSPGPPQWGSKQQLTSATFLPPLSIALLVDLSNNFGIKNTEAILANLQKEVVIQRRQ